MYSSIELLSPAGSMEALKAAVSAGADAVYLGGSHFSARANAHNFDSLAMKEAVSFCRTRGVKVYVTVNVLIKEQELCELVDYIAFLCEISVDAVIVQDLGLFHLIRKAAPKLHIHASTQMTVHSPAGVRFIKRMGARRVVLARELSKSEISEITENAGIPIEVFVHGAQCMSVSGQCYFSATLGERSGNRGMCAQVCRLPFTVKNDSDGTQRPDTRNTLNSKASAEYALSLKDLSLLSRMAELRKIGVASIKIEGRMKRPEYVAAATHAARLSVDGLPFPQELWQGLKAVFSRSGFTDAYFSDRKGSEKFGMRTKGDVSKTTKQVLATFSDLYRNERKTVPVNLYLGVSGMGTDNEGAVGTGQEIELGTATKTDLEMGTETVPKLANLQVFLSAHDDEGHYATARHEENRLEAKQKTLTRERCIEQLSKTGGTPIYIEETHLDTDIFPISVSELNSLRRNVFDDILNQRSKAPAIQIDSKKAKLLLEKSRLPHLTVSGFHLRGAFSSVDQLCPECEYLDSIQLPLNADLSTLLHLKETGKRIILEIPRFLAGMAAEEICRNLLMKCKAEGFAEYACGNLGAVELCQGLHLTVHGTYALNVTNSLSLAYLEHLGVQSTELSTELTGREISQLGGTIPRGVMVYGRQTVMLLRTCPKESVGSRCRDCAGSGTLIDRYQTKFPFFCQSIGKSKAVTLFNSVPFSLSDKQEEIKNADFGVLRFTVESSVECGEKICAWIRQEKLEGDYTRGRFYRGIQ